MHGKAQQMTEPTSVGWLSVEACVKKILSSYDAIVMSLEGEKDPKAIGLFQFTANSLNLLFSALLIGWLVDFGFNGPLRQYFSLYRVVSQREGERGKKG